ncbi:BTB/POZ domain-containing protein [Rhynchospora pubera]|uniref:BTB/POZ domain-containing protein n=1 Tax=Rhynchospora pubera TaxID=906938 RepID=A0AAV8HAU9_9POAL|nr:BTB/POZ domain-containing protein [Rhynchospora pubera]
MAEFSVGELRAQHTRIRNVPIAVTPEGFWCCPSPAALQKSLKNQAPQNKHHKVSPPNSKASSVQRAPTTSSEKRTISNPNTENPNPSSNPSKVAEKPQQKHKISVGFGQPETSDFKVVLRGKDGIIVKMSVHRNVLLENSTYFSEKLCENSPISSAEIPDCDDVEIYVETVGLMYCKDVKHRLVKQSVPRVLRILKVAEFLGFRSCVVSCLDYLEAVPWVGDEEENVVSYLRHLQIDTKDRYGISPLLRRVSSNMQNDAPNNTLVQIIELVLKSSEDRARREMKSVVSKLLKENSTSTNGSTDICIETLYKSCQVCLDLLLDLFRQASEPEFRNQTAEVRDKTNRGIALEADNLLWLLEILCDRHVGDDFVTKWAGQDELAGHHAKLPVMSRHLVSCVTARIFVGIGKGEVLPTKETRQQLIHVWLQPLIDDYNWLQHACRPFDRKVVEEGIGRTILTLPLEEQQTILLTWMGWFLKAGDACPNLQRAFEVWWRRTFIRPYVEQEGNRN